MTIRGIDIASHQSEGGMRIDWQAVKNAGNEFVVIKATGGAIYKNPYYAEQLAGARAAGLIIGHYHYAHELSFGQPRASAAQEAAFFLANSDIREGEFAVLDIEDPDVQPGENLAGFALQWLDIVSTAIGNRAWLYTYPYYAIEHGLLDVRFLYYPLWFAFYYEPYRRSPVPAPPAPFNKIAMWQWSGGTSVPGIRIKTDENFYFGTAEELRATGKPGLSASVQPSVEEPASARAYLNANGEAIVELNFGGWSKNIDGFVVPDAGVTTIGYDGKKYSRSIKFEFQNWEHE